jgi:hypothetical protein
MRGGRFLRVYLDVKNAKLCYTVTFMPLVVKTFRVKVGAGLRAE